MLRLRWTYATGGEIWATPVLVDLDGDGIQDIVIGSRNGQVHAIIGRNGQSMWVFRTRAEITASPVAVDLDADGLPEVLVGSHDRRLYALRADGQVMWSFETGGIIRTKPAVFRLEGEDGYTVVFANYDNVVYALDGCSGHLRWRQLLPYCLLSPFGKGIVSSPLVADLDQDGHPEIVIGTRNKRVFALDAASGRIRWFRRFSYGLDSSPSLAWLDGRAVVLIGSGESLNGKGDNSIYALDGATGRTIWRRRVKGGLDGSPSIADINGDGRLEVVETTLANASVYAWRLEDGAVLWRYRIGPTERCRHDEDNICMPVNRDKYFTQAAVCRSYSTPIFADLNRDGQLEVIFGSNNGWLYVLRGDNGEELFRYQTEGIVRASPVMGDIDGDGWLELVVCGGNRVHVFDAEASGSAWPMFKRDIYNRGNLMLDALEPPSGSHDDPAPADHWVKLRLAFSVYGLDILEYLAYQIEKTFLRPFGLRLFRYIY